MNIESQKIEVANFINALFPFQKDYRTIVLQSNQDGRQIKYINICKTLTSSDKRLSKLINDLNTYNDFNQIMISRNRYHYKQTTKKAAIASVYSICLESDIQSTEDQLEFFEQYKDYILAQVFSGNKSIHTYLKFELENTQRPPMERHLVKSVDNRLIAYYKNEIKRLEAAKDYHSSCDDLDKVINQYIGFSKNYYGKIKEQDYYFKEYMSYVPFIKKYFNDKGFKLDNSVLTDNHITRLPSFIHHKTGNSSKLIYFNQWDNVKDFKEIIDLVKIECRELVKDSFVLGKSLFESDGAINDIDCLGIDVDLMPLGSVLQRGKEEKEEADKDNVPYFQNQDTSIESQNRVISDYLSLTKIGFESGKRQANIELLLKYYGMIHFSKEEAISDLDKILMVSNKTTKSNTEIINDFKTYNPTVKSFIEYKGEAPSYRNRRIKMSKKEFEILEYIYNVVQQIPTQNKLGKTGLSSRAMNNITKRYGFMIKRFKGLNILKETNKSYIVGQQTKQYKIILPMLYYYLGLK